MKHRITTLILILSLFTSCSTLKPINSEYNLIRTSTSPEVYRHGNGKILIYNGAGYLNKIDDTARLNIWINDKALGQLRANEYVVLYLLPDTYKFKIKHKDGLNFENVHTIKIDNNTSVINVKPSIKSNNIEITNTIPLNFRWYRNVIK